MGIMAGEPQVDLSFGLSKRNKKPGVDSAHQAPSITKISLLGGPAMWVMTVLIKIHEGNYLMSTKVRWPTKGKSPGSRAQFDLQLDLPEDPLVNPNHKWATARSLI